MKDIQPTYDELKQKLAEAEKRIARITGNLQGAGDIGGADNAGQPGGREFIEAYIESEENFRNSLDACPLGILVVTDDDLFYVNQAALDIYGLKSITELKATPGERLLTPESHTSHRERIAKRQKGEYIPSEYEMRIIRPDGKVRTLQVYRREITWGGARRTMMMYQDITERLKLESAIQYHANLIENTPDAIVSTDKQYKIYSWNKGAEQMYGWRADEIIGENLGVLHPTPLHHPELDFISELRKNGSWSGEDIHQKKNGEQFPVLVTTSLIKDKNDNEVGIVTVAKDITERLKMENALQYHANLIENTPDAIVSCDKQFKIYSWNKGAAQMYSWRAEEVIGKDMREIVNPCHLEFPHDEFMFQLRKNGYWSGEDIHERKNGERFPVLMTTSVVRDKNNVELGVVMVAKDITERLKMENALRYHAYLVENIPDAIMSSDKENKLLSWNKGAENIYGWQAEEVMGKDLLEVVSPANATLSHVDFMKVLREQGSFTGQDEHHRKNGEKFPVLISSSLIKDKNGAELGVVTVIQDITELLKLQSSLSLNTKLVQSISDAIVSSDEKTLITSWNKAAEQMYGWREDEVIGNTVIKYTSPVFTDATPQEVLNEIRKNGYWNGEAIHHRRNGEEIYVLIAVSLMKDENGKEIGAVSVYKDITERKTMEAALRASEKRYHATLDNMMESCQIIDRTWRYVYINDASARLGRFNKDEFLGKTLTETLPGIEKTEVFAAFKKCMEQRVPVHLEAESVTPDGNKVWVDLSIQPIPEGIFILGLDITARKQAEERISHLNMALRSIRNINQLITREKNRDSLIKGVCDNLVLGRSFHSAWIVLFDENRQPVTWEGSNVSRGLDGLIAAMKKGEMPRCVQKALTRDEVIVTNDPPEECKNCPVQGDTKGIGSMTVRLESEGTLYGVLCGAMWGSILIDEDEISLFSEVAADIAFALRDISLRSTNELLQQEQLRAAKLESIGTLAGGIAHDFNNLLTGIMGNIGLAKNYLSAESEVYEMLDEAEKAAVRSRDLTQQLLTFARGGKPIKKITNITGVIKDSATFALRGSKVKLEMSLSPDLWMVEADEGQIGQVIHNLVINAEEAMPQGGTLMITASNQNIKKAGSLPVPIGNYVLIDVSDTGVGISRENLQKIFEPYFSTKRQGSGLGLTSAYSIIKSHGGSLLAESRLNRGSVFHAYLPATRKIAKGEKKVAAKNTKQAGGKILIMDDDEIIRKMLKNMLNLAGYQVEASADGVEALVKYKEAMDAHDPFTAVIMDLTVPGGMGGKEAVVKMREIDPAAAVIVSSGYATDPIMSEYRNYGFSAVIAKPYSIQQLQDTLTGLTSKKKK